MRVLVLSTSYPRGPDDPAGAFVRDAVEHLREAGVDVSVVSPATFRHFGLAYGHGLVGNLRRRPWRALLLPLFLLAYARAARRAARGVDLVHAHWLPSALPALATGFTLALARAVGEYGSVIFIAGNLPMRTEITPLLIVIKLEQYDYLGAAALGLVMLCVSFVMLLSINAINGWRIRRMAGRR